MKLHQQVALITGGTKGIGFGIAKAFVEEGAKVFICARSEDTGSKAAEELGESAVFLKCDATDGASLQSIIDTAAAQHGRLDILVNNAGGATEFAPVAQTTDAMWDNVISLNLDATFKASRAALRHMIPAGRGRIINISSVEGKHGQAGVAAYVAAKHGVNGFTKALAKEVGQLGITVNALCPGVVLTDLIRTQAAAAAEAAGMTEEQFLASFVGSSALGRAIGVEEVAAMALLLATDEGRGMTGTAISVDGGQAAY